jgi:ABC-type glutathione transport system ATPase component
MDSEPPHKPVSPGIEKLPNLSPASSTHSSSGIPEKPRSQANASPTPSIDPDSPYISFRAVQRVDVTVRNLAIAVNKDSARKVAWSALRGKKNATASSDVRILDDVSADMPAGQVMAIIGGSGSGKVRAFHVGR